MMDIIGYDNISEIEDIFLDIFCSDFYDAFHENIDREIIIRMNKILESKKGLKLLEKCGCFEMEAKTLEDMRLIYIKNYFLYKSAAYHF